MGFNINLLLSDLKASDITNVHERIYFLGKGSFVYIALLDNRINITNIDPTENADHYEMYDAGDFSIEALKNVLLVLVMKNKKTTDEIISILSHRPSTSHGLKIDDSKEFNKMIKSHKITNDSLLYIIRENGDLYISNNRPKVSTVHYYTIVPFSMSHIEIDGLTSVIFG